MVLALNHHHIAAITPTDRADFFRGLPLDRNWLEGRPRFLSPHTQIIELVDGALAFGQTDANIDFIFGVVRAVFANQQAICHHLDHRANGQDVGVEARGFASVDIKQPFYAGQGRCIFDIAKIADFPIDKGPHFFRCGFNLRSVATSYL